MNATRHAPGTVTQPWGEVVTVGSTFTDYSDPDAEGQFVSRTYVVLDIVQSPNGPVLHVVRRDEWRDVNGHVLARGPEAGTYLTVSPGEVGLDEQL